VLFPNDHARTLIEILKGFGPEGSDLIRRWVAALLLVPEGEREQVVAAVETRVAATYREVSMGPGVGASTVTLRTAPVQGDGFVEETERVFERVEGEDRPRASGGKKARGAGRREGRGAA
jgi:hypothetical protein